MSDCGSCGFRTRRPITKWISHVKKTQQQHRCTYKEALKIASTTYKRHPSQHRTITGKGLCQSVQRPVIPDAHLFSPVQRQIIRFFNQRYANLIQWDNFSTIEDVVISFAERDLGGYLLALRGWHLANDEQLWEQLEQINEIYSETTVRCQDE